jgi:hypothetical protein
MVSMESLELFGIQLFGKEVSSTRRAAGHLFFF